MAINIQQLYDLPDVSIIDDIDIETLRQEMIADYERKYKEVTGESIVLYPADKTRIEMDAIALKLYQGYQYIEKGFKMNLLKYAYGDYLKHLGAFKKTFIQEAKAAVTTLRFSLSSAKNEVIAIPQGIRATAGDNIFFATDEYAEIPIGSLFVDVTATCLTLGESGNNYLPGQISILADPIPYIENVTNIDTTTGGMSEEDDDSFREKIFLAPSSYSTAGPEDAYRYWVKQYNSSIADVKVTSTEDSIVDIRVILLNGELPSESFLNDLRNYLLTGAIKPLTDKILVQAPDVVNYELNATYYIGRSNINSVSNIQQAISEAAEAYVNWQKTGIGRDINSDALIELLRAAGAKRIVVETPVFQVIPETSIAIETAINLSYGGIEDD